MPGLYSLVAQQALLRTVQARLRDGEAKFAHVVIVVRSRSPPTSATCSVGTATRYGLEIGRSRTSSRASSKSSPWL